MTPDARRRRAIGQIALLTAGLLVLVAISAASVLLVNKSRRDSARVVHTIQVENQINALLLGIRRAESALRGYVLTTGQEFFNEHENAVADIIPDLEKLERLTNDNPAQIEHVRKLRSAIETRLSQFAKTVNSIKQSDPGRTIALVRDPVTTGTTATIHEVAQAMHAQEERLFDERTVNADHSQRLASIVTTAGSGLVIALAGVSIMLVRRSRHARDRAEAQLRDSYLNLETAIDERTADLREANNEIQRFAYIVSHDLRSPLVNIMGFTSELEELRTEIFRRIAGAGRTNVSAGSEPMMTGGIEQMLGSEDRKLSQDFSEALEFIKSSIGKMDRLINAILNLTREGRRKFEPVQIDMRELIEGIVTTLAHQAAEAEARISVDPLPRIVSDRLALEQIFSNLIDNAIKYLKPGVPGEIAVRGRTKLGFAIFEVSDNGRGIDPKDHQRIFELFRRAGAQDKPGQGIGLAHVRALVRRLGGTMQLSSELNLGSTFTITLPIAWMVGNRDGDK